MPVKPPRSRDLNVIDSTRHKDKRANIPTQELRDFVAEGEAAPKTMLYPRDPSLDPQLVWKGKDEQDREDLAVPVVPIYIQETIHPQHLIEDLCASSAPSSPAEPQADLFSDFNGLPEDFEKRVDFYNHEAAQQPHWSNRMILGDSLLVMFSVVEKVNDGKVEHVSRQPEQVRAFRGSGKLENQSFCGARPEDRRIS